MTELSELTSGTMILFGGNRVTHVTPEISERFQAGDRLLVLQQTGQLLLIEAEQHAIAADAVARAYAAFQQMGSVPDEAVTHFYDQFADNLASDGAWAAIRAANGQDVQQAAAKGRSTTRLEATDKMRQGMIEGLREWRDAQPVRGRIIETVQHDGWLVEQVVAPLGVVGFVFEGRPNVFADATGVLRGGNTVVFRIGSDALATAQAIVENALDPAIRRSGLPDGAATLLPSAAHSAGWAMFSDSRLSLAVARGSGRAVEQLGSVARQAGTPVSLHGTGGAWIIADHTADPAKLEAAVLHSLDRKVCNTLNVCCLPRRQAAQLVPHFLHALDSAGRRRGHGFRLHVIAGDEAAVPADWYTRTVPVPRSTGIVDEPLADSLPLESLSTEWEWEETPEVTLKLVDDTAEAVKLFNTYSPRFIASLISEDASCQDQFHGSIDAPFTGNGFTRWVDGQYALQRPELGLSNWQSGRLFARGGVLAGDNVYTIRARAVQQDPNVHR